VRAAMTVTSPDANGSDAGRAVVGQQSKSYPRRVAQSNYLKLDNRNVYHSPEFMHKYLATLPSLGRER
jgi:hypothetical protein